MQTTNFFIPTESFHFGKGNMEQDRRNGRRRLTVWFSNRSIRYETGNY